MRRGKRLELRNILCSLKKDGSVKGRGCADGQKQSDIADKDYASSLNISTETVLLIATIAAKQARKVTIVDASGAYLQTNLEDEEVIVKLEAQDGRAP